MMRTAWLSLSILLAVAAGALEPSAAQAPATDTLVSSYVAAFNAGDQLMKEFFQAHADTSFSVDTAMDRYRRMKEEASTLKLRRITSREAAAITAEMTAQTGMTVTVLFRLTGGDPPKIRGMNVKVTMGAPSNDEDRAAPPLAPRDEATAVADLEALLRKAVAGDEFSGAALVARNGRVLWERAVGEADKSRDPQRDRDEVQPGIHREELHQRCHCPARRRPTHQAR